MCLQEPTETIGLLHRHTPTVRPCQTSSNGGSRALLGAPVKRFAGRRFVPPRHLCLAKTKWRRSQEQPHEAQRSSQGQHTFACSATFQRTHHHPLDTASITTRNVLCVTVWDHRGARAMASTRGFLNIQSLNELTYENQPCRRAAPFPWNSPHACCSPHAERVPSAGATRAHLLLGRGRAGRAGGARLHRHAKPGSH